MPRHRRFDFPGLTQHVVQRGNNRQRCFYSDAERLLYLQLLREHSAEEQVTVHAWVLMDNHVHLLMTPSVAGASSKLLQAIGRRYVRWTNQRRERSGTLWEGRFRSCAVESGSYTLACYRYIELNPVRARMVEKPDDYAWSSHASNGHGSEDGIVQPHAAYMCLGGDIRSRLARYREFVAAGVADDELVDIRRHSNQQKCFGSDAWRAELEARTGSCARLRAPGRPRNVF